MNTQTQIDNYIITREFSEYARINGAFHVTDKNGAGIGRFNTYAEAVKEIRQRREIELLVAAEGKEAAIELLRDGWLSRGSIRRAL